MIQIANCTWEFFEKKVKESKVVVFGAGVRFKELCEEYCFADNIIYLVDNYIEDNSIEVSGKEIPIRRINEIGDEIREVMLIVSSSNYAEEICRQLDDIELLEGMMLFCPYLITVREEKQVDVIPKSPIQQIPKIIHYCWFGGKDIPERFQKNIDSWKKNCPDYEIKRWDESNYDFTKNDYMNQAYKHKMWGFVSDYARIDVVNEYGGIYVDTDVEVVKSLDELLSYKMFCGFQDSWSINFGLGFGSVKNHMVLEKLLKKYDCLRFENADGTLNKTVCATYQSETLCEYGLKRNNRTQCFDEFTAFSTKYFSPINPWGLGWLTGDTYSVHQYVGTWAGKDMNNRDVDRRQFFESRLVMCNEREYPDWKKYQL